MAAIPVADSRTLRTHRALASAHRRIAARDSATISTQVAVSEIAALTFSALLRGPASLGALYAGNGFPAVPSPAEPGPGSDDYFSGGDDTRRHACGAEAAALGGATAGSMCGVQIEANFTGVRDTQANRERFADVTAIVVQQYLTTHWGLSVGAMRAAPSLAPRGRSGPRAE